MTRLERTALLACVLALTGAGCTSSSPPPPSGFLSDYSALEVADDDGTHRYASPELKNYNAFIVDPVELRNQGKKTSVRTAEQTEVARYFTESLADTLRRHGYRVVDTPGAGVARFRVALTDIQASKWWRNHQPQAVEASGTGGAAMEGEVVDSVTGRQVAAVIQRGQGQQAALDEFSTLDDVKDTIDQWTRSAAARLDEIRIRAGVTAAAR